MRPLELRLRNFRSYFGESPVFDFRNRSLVGVVGPIGSGKSSLLDAVSFALYGKTPTAGANTKALIHQRAADGGVNFRFEVGGEIWEVVRILRRKGASQHALYRLDGDESGDEPAARVTLEGEVNDKIAALLGLDYDAFGRSVLLAQGRFAEFLRSRPAERDAVLKGVFGHDRIDAMREVAKTRAAAAAAEFGKVSVRTEQLDRIAVRLEESRGALAAAEARVEALRKLEPRLEDLTARLDAADQTAERSAARLAELAPHADRLPSVAITERLIAEASAIAEERNNLASQLEEAQARVVSADEALSAAVDAGEADRIDEATRLVAAAEPLRRAATEAERRHATAVRRHAAAEEREGRAAEQLVAADQARDTAAEVLRGADETVAAAEARRHEAQHADMAAALRRELAVGEPCPVCAQEVPAPVAALPAMDVDEAEAALQAARSARAAAEASRTRAAEAAAAAVTDREAAAAEVTRAAADVASTEEAAREAAAELEASAVALESLLGPGVPAELLDQARTAYAALDSRLTDARRSLEQVRSKHDQVILDEQGVAKRTAALRVELAELAARLAVAVAGDADDVASLSRAATTLRAAWEEETRRLETSRREALATRNGTAVERKAMLDEAGVEGEFTAALAAAETRAEHVAAEVGRDEAEIAAAGDLLAERDRLGAEQRRYERLAADLTNAKFVRFLLDDERGRLGRLGSEHFQRLSAGRYNFTDDGTFSIVDLTAADAVRKAASLSGGETFLASLALALALAEMVARTGGRLDAFFLDEGFGSLDPEHLDLAMEGIEALVAGDSARLVVVVSHVPELRHRIEDLIQLDRDPLTGDTRVLRS